MTENRRFEVDDRVVVTASSAFIATVGKSGVVISIDGDVPDIGSTRQIIRVRLFSDGGRWDNPDGFWFAPGELELDILGELARV